MDDILIHALEEQDALCHHGVFGMKWGIRRYQNPDGSLTDEGRKRYLKEDSDERKALDQAAANKASAEYRFNNAVDNYMERQRTKRFKELRTDKRLSKVSDRHLYDYYMDDLYDENEAREHVMNSNKKLADEVTNTRAEYKKAIKNMYDSVKDSTLDKIKVNKKTKDKLEQFMDLYENELVVDSYKSLYGDNWKKEYKEVFR